MSFFSQENMMLVLNGSISKREMLPMSTKSIFSRRNVDNNNVYSVHKNDVTVKPV